MPEVTTLTDSAAQGASKRRKRSNKRANPPQPSTSTLRPCLFERLPLEILAEILKQCSSTKDLLSVARCSKHFCSTLVFQGNDFIWKYVRKFGFSYPMPEPLPHFTESAYAAFVFDGGPCDFCNRPLTAPYASYSLRVRFCFQPDCSEKLAQRFCRLRLEEYPQVPAEIRQSVKEWLISSETSTCFELTGRASSTRVYVDRNELRELVREVEDAVRESRLDSLMKSIDNECIQRGVSMVFYASVYTWYFGRRRALGRVESTNNSFIRFRAREHGCNYEIFQSCKTIKTLLSLKLNDASLVTYEDLRRRSDDIQTEMLVKLESKRAHRIEENSKAAALAIDAYYNRLRSLKKHTDTIFPNFATFKTLPSIQSITNLTPDAKMDYQSRFQSDSLLRTMIINDLKQWEDKARHDLASLLGVDCTSATQAIHPVEQLDVRFLCALCEAHRRPGEQMRPHSLTFKSACAHSCPYASQLGQNRTWSPSWFQVDVKAKKAIRKALPSQYHSHKAIAYFIQNHQLGDIYACNSCEARIIMGLQDIAEHAHRHDDMDVVQLPHEEATSILVHPIERGLTKKLFGGNGPAGKKARDVKDLACRHCSQARPSVTGTGIMETEAREVPAINDHPISPPRRSAKSDASKRNPVVFSFNGMRCHLLTKHGVRDIRDEDYFRISAGLEAGLEA